MLAYANKSLGFYSVVLATHWFGNPHPAFPGGVCTCPASGCVLNMSQAKQNPNQWTHSITELHRGAHMLLFHMNTADFYDPAQVSMGEFEGVPTAPLVSVDGRPLGAVYRLAVLHAAENFNMHWRTPPWDMFNTEMTFRPSSFMRESYVLDSLAVPVTGATWSLDARTWQDIWPAPLSWEEKRQDVQATWASHYCEGSVSGREEFVRRLQSVGLGVLILGEVMNCLRNAPDTLLAKPRDEQAAELRKYPFHLAFENVRMPGYVTEKFYWALIRGQIPVVFGAPDIARHAPGPHSYIDASPYQNNTRGLMKLLKTIANNKGMHDRYHAWRTERGFDSYGDILRRELIEMVWLSNSTPSQTERYQCRLCHGLRRFEAAGGFRTKPSLGIKPFGEDIASGFDPGEQPRASNP
jgi:hypothetical protein